uniref:Olduvai domain-containing protein n=2 Tax=Macaca fascicularis TaxID=9541 RepID=A0A7N9CWE7_MACFA
MSRSSRQLGSNVSLWIKEPREEPKSLMELDSAEEMAQQDEEYEECKELIKSMLRDELQFKGEKLAEQLKQTEELRQYKVLVHSQAQELTQLREKLREGRDASRSLTQHLQALLTPDEPDKSQRQDLREQLAEGCRLAQHLVQKLSPENGQGEDADVQVEEAEKVQDSCVPREVQKAEEREVPEDSLEECAVTCSNSHGPYDSNQPHRNTKITFVEDEVDSTLIDSSFHDEWRMLYILSQKVKVMMRKRKKKGQCLPGNAVELWAVTSVVTPGDCRLREKGEVMNRTISSLHPATNGPY